MGFFERMKSLGKRIVETGKRIIASGRKTVFDVTSRITGRGKTQTNRSSAANKLPAAKPLDYKPINKPLESEVFDRSTKDYNYKADTQVREYKGVKSDSYFGRGETGAEKRISKATADKEGVLTDITPEQAQIFWQATRRAWEGKDPKRRYEYIREYFGWDSIADIFDYIMDVNQEAINVSKNKPVSTGDEILKEGTQRYSHRTLPHLSVTNVIDVTSDTVRSDFHDWLEVQ